MADIVVQTPVSQEAAAYVWLFFVYIYMYIHVYHGMYNVYACVCVHVCM